MTTVLCWGGIGEGQLGLGAQEDTKVLVPQEHPRFRGEEIRDIACGVKHTLVVLKSGAVLSCGSNEFGQLGREGAVTKFAPVEALKAQRVLQVAAGSGHSLALTEAREVFSWGDNSRGQLGRGQVVGETRRTPKLVKALAVYFVVQVSCGHNHSIALTNEGHIFVWGCNTYGQLGLGMEMPCVDVPQLLVCLGGIPMRQVVCGGFHTMALTHSGAVFGWGKNVSGQLGVNDEKDKPYPMQCRTLRSQRIKYISCGEEHTAALTKEGGVFTFGLGTFGQLGHSGSMNQTLPLQTMELMGSEVTQVACGRRHTLAYVAKTGRLYGFGLNSLGQLGINSTTNKDCPTQVQGPFVAPPEDSSPTSMQVNNDPALVVIRIYSGGNHNFIISCPAEMKPQPANYREPDPRSQVLLLKEEHIKQVSQLSSSHPPSVELEEEMVKIFSHAACLNGAFLRQRDGHYCCSSQNHGIDLEGARKAFKQLSETSNVFIMQKIANSLEQSLIPSLPVSPPDVEALRLYLLLPECHLYDEPKYFSSLICPLGRRLLNLDRAASRVLETWWSSLGAPFFQRIVYVYKNCVSYILQLPDTSTAHEVEKRGSGLYVSLELLKKLSTVNDNMGQIIPYHKFYVPNLHERVNLRRDYVSWLARGSSTSQGLHFCNYPFLFDAPAKSLLLETDALLQMQTAVDAATRINFANVFLPMPIDAAHPCLVLYITRANIVQNTLEQLNRRSSADLKKPLKVIFMGEEAVDAGGVKKEFFLLLLREILDPKFGMFKYYEESRLLWFNPQTFEDKNMFHMIGILCGLAIYNCTIINLNFPQALYKKLLKRPVTLDDMKELSPTEGRSLQALLDYDGEDFQDVFGLTFEMSMSVFGEMKTVELCPDGANVPVTLKNRQDYVNEYIRYIFDTSVEELFREFNDGFHKVCGGKVLEFFHPQELQAMVIGNENYDFLELEKNTNYKDAYHRYHPTIQIFWEVFHELDMEDKKKFLLFLTGSDRIPVYGMKNIKMVIQPTGGGENFLPVAHTCFNVLDLPQYTNKETLRAKLKMAIEQTEGFGLV